MSEFKDKLIELSNKEFLYFYMEMMDSMYIRERSLLFKIRGVDPRHQKPHLYKTVIGLKLKIEDVYNWTDPHNPPEWAYLSVNIAKYRQGFNYALISKAKNEKDDSVYIVELDHYLYLREIHNWKWIKKRDYLSMIEKDGDSIQTSE